MRTPLPAIPEQASPALPGEALTRRAVTVITGAIVAMAFAFSLGNVTHLCLDLGITAWIAWMVAPAVDLSVIGLLAGMRFLSLHVILSFRVSRGCDLRRLVEDGVVNEKTAACSCLFQGV